MENVQKGNMIVVDNRGCQQLRLVSGMRRVHRFLLTITTDQFSLDWNDSTSNSLLSLGGQTVHQNEYFSGPPDKLAVQNHLITKVVANGHFITEHSWLIVLNL